ncbi:MAG: NAD(P)/FAD-dependent oxidoreductase [Thaumarchaeota archaeon]|nr:NAD(P)/FAD-dependent oxidoreductase [Nitrososphaerota archaeon]
MSRVNIIGASIAGLIAAREISSKGIDTTVYEEHREIGIPEKCDGLVSAHGISELGIVPPSNVVQNKLTHARFFSPSMKEVSIDARKQNVVVLDRSRFDKYLAENAARAGAKIELGERVSNYSQTKEEATIKVGPDTKKSDILLDCSGYESYIRNGGTVLQAGQYLVYGTWFEKSTVEVYLDPVESPGFFKWVIPISSDVAKIGVAGKEINTFSILDSFVKEKEAVPFRKAAAPIICSGIIKKFADGRIVKAGDSAGQPKPTTGGGIYTGGFGGQQAGRAIVKSLESNDLGQLDEYEKNWRSKFGDEFRTQLYARNVFAKMNSKQLDQLVDMINSSDLPKRISDEGDFDRHSIAIMKAFGISNLFSTLGMVITNEIKNLLS